MKTFFVAISLLLALSTWGQSPKRAVKKLGDDPVYFIDSIRVGTDELMKHLPEDIAQVSVYKDSTAIKLVGPEGKDGVVYIQTKVFARSIYWAYFRSKSIEYAKIALTPQDDSTVQYILNGRVLTTNYEGNLSLIDDSIFRGIQVIDKKTLQEKYHVQDKSFGVLIESEKPDNLYKARKKF
ncbi:MAG: hypothetical protein EOP48_29780 [Sphingobacteriales bacterium]|nr:MAG: hypothetical protein EOP48_29780 [Sphingobacteriales bacterium]